MKTDWKRIAVIAIVLVFSASVIAPLALAGDGKHGESGEFHGKGARGFEKIEGWRIHGGDRDRWADRGWIGPGPGVGGIYPSYGYSYPYPVFVPAGFGGSQGACYQACVNSGQYLPAQCGEMCYYAL